jgi:biopolymer transport protein ExbB/TolQ
MSRKLFLLLRVMILTGLIAFAFVLTWQYGLLELAISMDRSYLSSVILVIYGALSCHWLVVAAKLAIESDAADVLENKKNIKANKNEANLHSHLKSNLVYNLQKQLNENETPEAFREALELFSDQVSNRHAFGYFASDVLLRLGLLGTIIGFILMLLPVSNIKEFDSSIMQQLLASMSGGMAVALYTTLTGLITSTLLRFQYFILESAATDMIYRTSLAVSSRSDSVDNAS